MVVLGGGAVSYERGTPVNPEPDPPLRRGAGAGAYPGVSTIKTRNSRPETLDTKSETRNPRPEIRNFFFFFTLVTGPRRSLSLKLGDTRVYEPHIQARKSETRNSNPRNRGERVVPNASPHPTPYTLHPTPYTLHPTPYTPHPTPYTLHPQP